MKTNIPFFAESIIHTDMSCHKCGNTKGNYIVYTVFKDKEGFKDYQEQFVCAQCSKEVKAYGL